MAGKSEGEVEVDISYDIIRQMSKQLYTNPRKAIEELICNGYDAGASKCFVKTPLQEGDFLAVLDNGKSMDFTGLRDLWKVAVSPKENLGADRVDNGRQQIGKFGVGKLAAFSLGQRLTHVATKNKETRIVSVGQDEIRDRSGGKKPSFEVFKLPEKDARSVLDTYLKGLPKPWEQGWESWTLAIVDEIDEENVGHALKIGFLRKMVGNALPVSSKFEVYLNGEPMPKRQISPADIEVTVDVIDPQFMKRLENALKSFWGSRLGDKKPEDVPKGYFTCEIGKMPSPDDVDEMIPALLVPKLGPVSGNAIIARKTLTTERLAERGYQDNGFAIYARGRQINPEDELFGVTPRTHGYWRRFLARIEMPGLDKVLLVQRNSVSENHEESLVAREILRELFNEARVRADEFEETGDYIPEPFGQRLHMLSPIAGPLALHGLTDEKMPDGGLSAVNVDFAPLGEAGPPSLYDQESSTILINEAHPIVAALDERGEAGKELRQVLAEVIAGTLMAGGYLKARGVDEGLVQEAQDIIDDSLRSAAGYLEDEIEKHIREIEEASHEGGQRFENAVVRAFRDCGLTATRYGGPGETDAIIEIYQAAAKNLLISVEAKGSKGIITHKELHAATIERHRKKMGCIHAIAIARVYAGEGRPEKSALEKETEGQIPLITTAAIAKMLRLHKKRPFTHDKIKEILTTWKRPDEVEQFVESVWAQLPDLGLLAEILEIAWAHMNKDEHNYPEPGVVIADSRMLKRGISRQDVVRIIEAVQIATQMILIRDKEICTFELLAPPKMIMEALTRKP